MSFFTESVSNSTGRYTSDDKQITVERFFPLGAGPFPAVIALHGSGGLRGFAEEPARLLAARGFAVFVLHYFDRTGTNWADERSIRKHFPLWMKAISDAVTYVGHQRQVDASRTALLGFSLGGYLALAVASQDPRVRAVVEFFGGIPEELSNTRQMPPTLILHGDADHIVPISEARNVEKLLQRIGTPYEIKVYPGAGHVFTAPLMLDAGLRTLRFLQKHLQSKHARQGS
ncbi:MAG: dienelactone hydrolase family protein [Terriglobales bacterium]